VAIPRTLLEYVLLGPADDRRQLQDSPILGDVWAGFAKNANAAQDLLITPFRSNPAGKVAARIADRLGQARKEGRVLPRRQQDFENISYLQGLVAARLYLDELLEVVLPVTCWWHDKVAASASKKPPDFESMLQRVLHPDKGPEHNATSDGIARYVSLAALLLWAADPKSEALPGGKTPPEMLRELRLDELAKRIAALFARLVTQQCEPLVWQISLNRKALPALDKSVPAVKADAATTLFSVRCDQITWAVLDSGIDGSHPAFLGVDEQPRVKAGFDFTFIREIISLDNRDPGIRKHRLEAIYARRKKLGVTVSPKDEASDLESLEQLAADAEEARPIHWSLVERFIRFDPAGAEPESAHGTHVAGILGGRGARGSDGKVMSSQPDGMCPDINLYDFRILSKTIDETEFAIIAALQYIRHLNERSGFVAIHGVNLSLSIPHDVRNFACGRTPICQECERLVDNGLVVVAAAGNRGYQTIQTTDGSSYEGYMAFSVTDPGNADGVITVGATHRYWPHTYGVSFFSSRGPTGDGRAKPDLVAPGERIRAPIPNKEWGELDGTSMAAPHVSGAAAMLMARYSELIGQPRRIKQILCSSATDLGRERSFQGHGMLDVLRAFQSI
jgi:hypothetical protein